MPVPTEIQEFHQSMAPLEKEARRLQSSKLAAEMTQRHALGTDDPKEQLLMRHYFVYLPVEDIAKYMGNFMLGITNPKKEARSLLIGEPPMWASVCRMMHACYNKPMWEAVWKTKTQDLGKANAQVLAGLYSVAYDKQYYDGWLNATKDTDSVWLNPDLFADWHLVQNETKVKIWMVVSAKKDTDLLRQFAHAMQWDHQWALADNLLGENMFHSDHTLREIALKQLLFSKKKIEVYDLPALDMA